MGCTSCGSLYNFHFLTVTGKFHSFMRFFNGKMLLVSYKIWHICNRLDMLHYTEKIKAICGFFRDIHYIYHKGVTPASVTH